MPARSMRWMGFAMLFCIAIPSLAQTLPRYSCQSKHFDVDLWMQQYKRTFDKHGVVMQDGQYHPLSIAIFGIMQYDRYMATHDSLSYRHIMNQYAYFAREGNITWIDDGKGAGLPYRKAFKDLKVPWYSGMTQGVAISFVLRYFCLTQDPVSKALAQKLAYFMLRPVEEGGTISTTPEELTWIEEYPNSKKSKHVLNGFINGLIGLHEYVLFFPEDTLARSIHDLAYKAMVQSFPLYDAHDWTNYNRNFVPVSNQYMRYQLTELEHLHELYRDPVLIRQMMIWASFAYLKRDNELKFYQNPDYQFGRRMQDNGTIDPALDSLFFADGFNAVTEIRAQSDAKAQKLPLAWKRNKALDFCLPSPTTYLILRFSNPIRAKSLTGTAEDELHHPVLVEVQPQGNALHIRSCEPFSNLQLHHAGVPKTPKIIAIEAFAPDNIQVPKFLFDSLSPTPKLVKGQPYKVAFEAENTCDLTIFYKYADKSGIRLTRMPWRADQFITDASQPFIPPADGHYMFFYAFRYQRPNPSFKSFEVKPWK